MSTQPSIPAPPTTRRACTADSSAPSGTVAVVMTCFNEGPWVEQAVDSVLSQTASDHVAEIVIADDGSGPATLEILDGLSARDPRIVVHRHRGFGVSKNRNVAIRSTQAPLIAILDADDWWVPRKLEAQIGFMQAQPSVGLVYSAFMAFQDGEPESATSVPVLDHGLAPDPMLAYFMRDPPIIPSTILMRRTAFEAAGGFDASVPVFEDTEFFARLSGVTRLAAMQTPLIWKRNHPGSITSRRSELMMHHAFVAFHLARREPRLLPHIGRRLAERARKLGNLEAQDGHHESASYLYRLSLSLWPFNPMTWGALAAQRLGGAKLVRRLRRAAPMKA